MYQINVREIDTLVIPLGSETLWLSSNESFAWTWTSGTTKDNAIATRSPKVPTESKGSEKPPILYNVDPNAGPKEYQTWTLDIESDSFNQNNLGQFIQLFMFQLGIEEVLLGLYQALAFLPIM